LHTYLLNIINQTILLMNNFIKTIIITIPIVIITSCSSSKNNGNTLISLKTSLGEIKIRLYDSTPVHRDNFIKLVNSGVYDNVSFHRIIKDFMIQAGDPSTKPKSSKNFPDSLNTYTLPAEIIPAYFHKRGAVAAARKGNEENPEMRSSGTQFYIVQGVRCTDSDLDQADIKITTNIRQVNFSKFMKQAADSLQSAGKNAAESLIQETASMKMFDYLSSNHEYKIPDDHRTIYKESGGVPRLDVTYTVFGEVVEGLDVVDKIAAVNTDSNDKPVIDVRIITIKIERK
jgi:cyclophilin family peptidyl-prolyl cis-trans isomerase